MSPFAIFVNARACLNDQKGAVYTNAVLLPYYNMAQQELQEVYEENDIPVTHQVSTVIQVNSGVTAIGFNTVPALPVDLIEIKQVWERMRDVDPWTMMHSREFLPLYIEGTQVSAFQIYAWVNQELRVPSSLQDNDLKLDYVKSIFSPITASQINIDNVVVNSETYLWNKTAALAAYWIGENETRAAALSELAEASLSRTLRIGSKGRQKNLYVRRPYRAGYKSRNYYQ